MSTPNPVDPQKKLDAVLAIIREIAKKSNDGDYIYRGESECHLECPYYGTVSSSLWREYFSDLGPLNIAVVEEEMLRDAKRHIGQVPRDLDSVGVPNVAEANTETIDFEILTGIQHYGGKTNLIDFTTDFLIALFFACDGNHDKDGRVILQKTEQIRAMIKSPQNPRHRVIAQKSIFVYPPTGVIEPHENDIVIIPAHLKTVMLDHLRTYHDISTETIYNDLHGFIKNQGTHGGAYTQFYKGVACQDNDKAIKNFDRAIQLNPNFAMAYALRGFAYLHKQDNDKAFKDFTEAIQLNPNSHFYGLRSSAYNRTGEYDKAILDCNKAIELNPNNANAHASRSFAYNRTGEYEKAISDGDEAIRLDPNNAVAYYNLGITWLHLERWERARSNLTTAYKMVMAMGMDMSNAFHDYYPSITNFEQTTGIQLPPDIVAMLTPP